MALFRGSVSGHSSFTLAERFGIAGYVTNTPRGVLIEAEGLQVDAFIEALRNEAPPLSQILSLSVTDMPSQGDAAFRIRESRDEGSFTHISPDVAVCDDCLREMRDPADRRYRYPFINQLHELRPALHDYPVRPYDRPNTTMAGFPLCEQCSAEYHDPETAVFMRNPMPVLSVVLRLCLKRPTDSSLLGGRIRSKLREACWRRAELWQ